MVFSAGSMTIASRAFRLSPTLPAPCTYWTAWWDGVPTSRSSSPVTSSCPSSTTWLAVCMPNWAACMVWGVDIPTTRDPGRTWTWACTRWARTVRLAAVSWCRRSNKQANLCTDHKTRTINNTVRLGQNGYVSSSLETKRCLFKCTFWR